ncbi:hypothetical protein IMCC26207_110375 [Actinobacteria bacterium IMCC26207]|nr:hypothetical protein IMCC26207_110375 [Actinobacteria bacterium IMCC26207]
MFAVAVTLAVLLASMALIYLAIQKLSQAGEELQVQQFVPAVQVAEELRHASDELSSKVDERTKG